MSRKIVRDGSRGPGSASSLRVNPWRLLVVDDEPDIISLTRISLSDFHFDGRPLEIVQAASGFQAQQLLTLDGAFAVVLIDVVMESPDAGLLLVEFIRNHLQNRTMRLIIRTGQPGFAPEKRVIDAYDIDDYKEKTELTAWKLYTTVRTAIKSYRDLTAIAANRRGLERILEGSPDLYRYRSLERFFQGVLQQVGGLLPGNGHGFVVGTFEDLSALFASPSAEDGPWIQEAQQIRSGLGRYAADPALWQEPLARAVAALRLREDDPRWTVDETGHLVLPLTAHGQVFGVVYLELQRPLSSSDQQILSVFALQCGSALENFQLLTRLEQARESLAAARRHALHMLAVASEYKDQETGNHVQRIEHYSRAIAESMGLPAEECAAIGDASVLHDLGKIAIPDLILQKPGRLTEEEWVIMRTHSEWGARILGEAPWFQMASQIALFHHEQWDGNGYPNGLRGEAIPLSARVVAVADCFDALVCTRPYKAPWPIQEAVAEIRQQSGLRFDPTVVAAFLKVYDSGRLETIRAELGRY
ncbi:MAG: DUF3369 domain-containing protein [Magnetococcus sp. MYC-9]